MAADGDLCMDPVLHENCLVRLEDDTNDMERAFPFCILVYHCGDFLVGVVRRGRKDIIRPRDCP